MMNLIWSSFLALHVAADALLPVASVLVVVVAVAVVVSSVGGSAGGGRIVVGVSTGSGH